MTYYNTLIEVAPDTRARAGIVPPERDGKKSIALLEYELISAAPYVHTQEEVQFAVHVTRTGIDSRELELRRQELWDEFFSRSRACMRSSPLPKLYGWGLHFNGEGRVALVAMESAEYARLLNDPSVTKTRAMRSRRA